MRTLFYYCLPYLPLSLGCYLCISNYCQAFDEGPHSKLLILCQVGTLPKASPEKHVKEHTIEVIIDIQYYYEIYVLKFQGQNCMFLYFLYLR